MYQLVITLPRKSKKSHPNINNKKVPFPKQYLTNLFSDLKVSHIGFNLQKLKP